MQKIICSTEEAEPPGTRLAAFPRMDAESTQHYEHNILPNIKKPRDEILAPGSGKSSVAGKSTDAKFS